MKRGQAKKKPSGKDRDRRKKKALAGPRKPAKNKRTQRRAMIAASEAPPGIAARAGTPLVAPGGPPGRPPPGPGGAGRAARLGRRRAGAGSAGRSGCCAGRSPSMRAPAACCAGPAAGCGRSECWSCACSAWSSGGCGARAAWAVRASTRASAVISPERAICARDRRLRASACVVSQFVDYRGVEIGQPGYAGLPDVAQAADRRRRRPPATPTPTCWSRSALLAVALGVARGRAASATAARAGRLRPRAAQRSP